jgi:hypothetical protein
LARGLRSVGTAMVAVAFLLASCAAEALDAAQGSVGTPDAAEGATGTPANDPTVEDILAALDSDRVTHLTASDESVDVRGAADSTPGDSLRTMWYATIAGLALSRSVDAQRVTRSVVDAETGDQLEVITDPSGTTMMR